MPEKYQSLVEMLIAWFGGGLTTLFAAATGRLMWHTIEVRKAHRKFFGKELCWELPLAVGMAIIGEGVAIWLEAGPLLRPGIIGGLAYLGPRGMEVLFFRWFAAKVK
ncbi:phage holin family protein [Ferirhizobium litorale]|uniref:Phage holin family protein n=1 Tax=Ferirhizobium litorale TaxID=2927786 RepID=A0AAE3QK82_9HYPH|nr:phage holin family protein [Fererhizobium litorale]MDI7924618.1 phage holin family protein [Fererhizobium litorale]